MAANPYRYLPLTTIQPLLSQYLAAQQAVLSGAQSYSMNGVSITRANLSGLESTIGLLSQAIRLQTGQAVLTARPITACGGR